MNDSPTLRADSAGFIQIVIPATQTPPSARLNYILYDNYQTPVIVLRVALPGRRVYMMVDPLLPAHRQALHRLSGQVVVRLLSTDGRILASLFQPAGERQNLHRTLSKMPAERLHAPELWSKVVQEVRRKLPAAAEIPPTLEGVDQPE